MPDERKLKIYYDGPIDRELDKELILTAEKMGWTFYASGFGIDNERDLAFYKKEH